MTGQRQRAVFTSEYHTETARRIITARSKENKKTIVNKQYTVNQLVHDIAETTKVKTSYVREAKTKENRFMALLNGINVLWKDSAL